MNFVKIVAFQTALSYKVVSISDIWEVTADKHWAVKHFITLRIKDARRDVTSLCKQLMFMKQVHTYLSMLCTQKLFTFFHILKKNFTADSTSSAWRAKVGEEETCCEQDITKCYSSALLYFRKHHRNSFSPPLSRWQGRTHRFDFLELF